MGAACCETPTSPTGPAAGKAYRRVLWAALVINASMFGVELFAGATARSVSLWADSTDFLADAANYGISLLVLSHAASLRAQAALFKGLSLGAVGLLVAGATAWRAFSGHVPDAEVMGAIGFVALVANVLVAFMLYAYRRGDADMRSVWICSRNDAIGNVAVMLAALGVFGTKTGGPDLVVAAVLASLALSGAFQIVRQSLRELPPRRSRHANGPMLSAFVDGELDAYGDHRLAGRVEKAWAALERAHVLSQPSARLHTKVHFAMLVYALRLSSWAQVRGQLARLAVAGVGSWLGRAPIGNTGRSNVPILQPMPIAPELEAKLAAAGGGSVDEGMLDADSCEMSGS